MLPKPHPDVLSRRLGDSVPEDTDKLFVVNRDDHYLGILQLSQLVTREPDDTVAEAMSLAGDHRHAELRRLIRKNRRELDTRWRRNVVLNKWLEDLSEQGHLILER